MIPLKEAGMKLSISDSLEYWCGLVEYAKKILSLARVTNNDVKSSRYQEIKVGVTYYINDQIIIHSSSF